VRGLRGKRVRGPDFAAKLIFYHIQKCKLHFLPYYQLPRFEKKSKDKIEKVKKIKQE
jgi:hypothetical protein